MAFWARCLSYAPTGGGDREEVGLTAKPLEIRESYAPTGGGVGELFAHAVAVGVFGCWGSRDRWERKGLFSLKVRRGETKIRPR